VSNKILDELLFLSFYRREQERGIDLAKLSRGKGASSRDKRVSNTGLRAGS
jgi:hypothetical protein